MPHGIDALLIDIAGVLVDGAGPLPGALEATVRLRAAGVPFRLVTNLSRLSTGEISRRLEAAGFSLDPDEIWNPPRVAGLRLAQRRGPALTAVAPNCLEITPPESTGPEQPLVIMGDCGRRTHAERLRRLGAAVQSGAETWLLANRPDPAILGLAPGEGFEDLLELSRSGPRPAELIGKPAGEIFRRARLDLRLPEAAVVAMVGDDLDVDLAGAAAAGLATVLVLSGQTHAATADAAPLRPTHRADDLGAFVHRWLKIR